MYFTYYKHIGLQFQSDYIVTALSYNSLINQVVIIFLGGILLRILTENVEFIFNYVQELKEY